MKPIGPLMREHRLIERMINILEKELRTIKQTGTVNTHNILMMVDFFRTYADRTHHGKEEDILFRDLAKKNLSAAHKQTMHQLVEDHIVARKTVGALFDAVARLVKGDTGSLKEMISHLETLIALYPKHISVEDKEFFYPCMEYFSHEEQGRLLQEFWEFDKKMIHETYTKLVTELER